MTRDRVFICPISFRNALIMAVALLMTFSSATGALAQKTEGSSQGQAIELLKKLRAKAKSGLVITYRKLDTKTNQSSLERLSIKGSLLRLDEVLIELKDGEELCLLATTTIQDDSTVGSPKVSIGQYGQTEGLSARDVFDAIASSQPPRLSKTSLRPSTGVFTHVAWRYGRTIEGWFVDKLAGAQNIEEKELEGVSRLSFDAGGQVREHISLRDPANPRIIKRSGRPLAGKGGEFFGFDFFESSDKTLSFTRTSDYSVIPEHILQREDQPNHKVPRGLDEDRFDYEILEEKFGLLDDSHFDFAALVKKGSSNALAGLQAKQSAVVGATSAGLPAASEPSLIRPLIVLLIIAVAGFWILKAIWPKKSKTE